MSYSISTIISALEEYAPLSLQEKWDNSGLQVGLPDGPEGQVTGILLCLDVTEAIVAEAVARRCNMIVSHHPLIFKGLKSLTGRTPAERTVAAAIRAGVAVYSSHTALDSTRGGVSYEMTRLLEVEPERALAPVDGNPATGLGIIGTLPHPVTMATMVERIKARFGTPCIRASLAYHPEAPVTRVALCGGSGGEFISTAAAAGADIYISADIRYHDMADAADMEMAIFDIGHFESEKCAKDIFYRVITKKFNNFAVYLSEDETIPVKYL